METIKNFVPVTYVRTTGLILFVAVLFPFLVHLIPPLHGVPIGAYLLPMFYIPFIALVWYRWTVALPVAILAPILNFMITGNPQWGLMTVLTLELAIFTGVAYLLLSQAYFRWVAALLGYIGAKIISSLLLLMIPLVPVAPWQFFVNSLSTAVPGLAVLLLINILLLKYGPSKINQ